MPQNQIMTLEEKTTIGLKAIEFKKQGNLAEYERIMKSIPLEPYLAKIAKDYFGSDALIKTGINLSEAEAEYGPNWLNN
ncbi:MAG: hypothetical protein FWB78_11390 [Treponema sp.]|nr:hypothetical protein [Treponema sp.]